MTRIKISTNFFNWPFLIQTPGSSGVWGDCQFVSEESSDTRYDWWVVYEGLQKQETALCDPKKTILITAEPTHIKKYSPEFLKQFETIITTQKTIVAPHKINFQLVPWHVGAHFNAQSKTFDSFNLGYDQLISRTTPQKTKLVSVLWSHKENTRGHKDRLKFINILKKHFGEKIDVWGTDTHPCEDKWQAIAPYKYHIVIENGAENDYWTEKLADAFLGASFPIYYGCPNIHSYFDTHSLAQIDIRNPREAISIIENLLKSCAYEQNITAIQKSRELVLNEYQIFPRVCQLLKNRDQNNSTSEVQYTTLEPEVLLKDTVLNKWLGHGGSVMRKLFPNLFSKS